MFVLYGPFHDYPDRISNYQFLTNMIRQFSQQFLRLLSITNDQPPLPPLLKKRSRKNNKQNRFKRHGTMVHISDAIKFLVLVLAWKEI